MGKNPRVGGGAAMSSPRLPYGFWTIADGSEVLFNRRYKPLYERAGDHVTPADPDRWFDDIAAQHWFWRDTTPEAERRTIGASVLLAWGVAPAAP